MATEDKLQEIRDQIRVEREVLVDYYKDQARVYRSISRARKQDGSDYVNYGANFKFTGGVSGHFDKGDAGEITLRIYAEHLTADGRTRNDTLYETLYENVASYDPRYDELKASGRLVERGVGLHDFYNLTPDETMEMLERRAKKAETMADSYANDPDLEEVGVEMYRLLDEWLALKKNLERRGLDEDLKIWSGHYSPVRTVLERTIFPSIR